MDLTIIGASDVFARGLATWAVAAKHNVTIVGFNRGQAEELVKSVHAARAAGPRDPLLDNVIFLAMPYNCVLDARDSYGKQLDGRIVVDVTTPFDLDTFEPIHPEAGSAAQEIAKVRPGQGREGLPSQVCWHAGGAAGLGSRDAQCLAGWRRCRREASGKPPLQGGRSPANRCWAPATCTGGRSRRVSLSCNAGSFGRRLLGRAVKKTADEGEMK